LFDSYCISSRIRLELSVEPINLNVSQAIPCGLILNELVTNSLRHAFVDGRAGTVRIAFRAIESDSVELIVEDDGVGLPENFSARNRESLGLQVVDALIHQLRAVLHVASEGGAHFRFRWRPGGSD